MKRLSLFLTAWMLAAPAQAQELFANIGHIKDGLAAITGLKFKHDVPLRTNLQGSVASLPGAAPPAKP